MVRRALVAVVIAASALTGAAADGRGAEQSTDLADVEAAFVAAIVDQSLPEYAISPRTCMVAPVACFAVTGVDEVLYGVPLVPGDLDDLWVLTFLRGPLEVSYSPGGQFPLTGESYQCEGEGLWELTCADLDLDPDEALEVDFTGVWLGEPQRFQGYYCELSVSDVFVCERVESP